MGSKTAAPPLCRVLILLENEAFPWDRRMWQIATALQEAGYRVSVISRKDETPGCSSFEVLEGIKVYRYKVRDAKSVGGYILEYVSAFIRTLMLTMSVWMREGIDIVHSANPPDIFFPLAWFLRLFGVKYIFDEHDLSPELYEAKFGRRGLIYRILLALQRASYRAADLVISTNLSYRDTAMTRGELEERRVAIVRNGVDLRMFYARPPRPELKQNFKYMAVYLGVMGRQDGVDGLMHVAREIVHGYGRRDILFVFIGKGECVESLKKLAGEVSVQEYVRFTGNISDELLIDYLSTADVGLAPDLPHAMNQLSTMTKILEYIACGRPVVSFDLLESRRSAGDAAVYVPGWNTSLFAKELSDLLDDPARRYKMGQVGLARTRELLCWDRSRAALLEAYSRLSGRCCPLGRQFSSRPLPMPPGVVETEEL